MCEIPEDNAGFVRVVWVTGDISYTTVEICPGVV